MYSPAHSPQHQLTKEVAVACCPRTMVRAAIALDPEQVTSVVPWVTDTKVNPVTARTDLHIYPETAIYESCPHSLLEIVGFREIWSCGRSLGRKFIVPLGEVQEAAKCHRATIVWVDPAKVVSSKARDENASPLRSRDEDVQPPPASLAIDRAEVHTEPAGIIL